MTMDLIVEREEPMQTSGLTLAIFLVALIGFDLAPTALRADEKKQGERTVKGIRFNVAPDWPIEDRGETVGPIPVEEYLALKFNKVDGRLGEVESRFPDIEARLKTLNSRLAALEKSMADINEKLTDVGERLRR